MPAFAQTTVARLARDLEVLRQQGFRLAVIDTPPAITMAIQSVIAVAELIVIPTRPSPHDLRAVGATVDLCDRAGKPLIFVVNAATPKAKITYEAAVALSQHGTVAPVTLHHRTDFAASMIDGRTVMEVDPKGRSAQRSRPSCGTISPTASKRISAAPCSRRRARRPASPPPARVRSAASAAASSASKGAAGGHRSQAFRFSLFRPSRAQGRGPPGHAAAGFRPGRQRSRGPRLERHGLRTAQAGRSRRATRIMTRSATNVVEHPRAHPTRPDAGRTRRSTTSRPRSPSASTAPTRSRTTTESRRDRRAWSSPRPKPSLRARRGSCAGARSSWQPVACAGAGAAPGSARRARRPEARARRRSRSASIRTVISSCGSPALSDGRSAQQLVTDALDQLLERMPDLDGLAAKAKRRG